MLEYFDAYLIGLTATPTKQTFGFFNQNLVMEYGHEQAVADGVNVNYDVYRIRTEITEAGTKVEAGYYVDVRDKRTRARRAGSSSTTTSPTTPTSSTATWCAGPDPHHRPHLPRQAASPTSSPAAPRCPRR